MIRTAARPARMGIDDRDPGLAAPAPGAAGTRGTGRRAETRAARQAPTGSRR